MLRSNGIRLLVVIFAVLGLGLSLASAPPSRSPALPPIYRLSMPQPSPTLADLARRQNLFIGAAVNLNALGKDRQYRHHLGQEFNLVTAENVMKLRWLQPRPREFDFTQADQLVAFAAEHNMAVRGHTLVWHRAMPDWLRSAEGSREQLMAHLEHHIKTVVGRYRGQIVAWDVVNEAIADDGTLRDTPWLRGIGPDYIEMAFRWAHEADPDALLIYNDYGGEGLNRKSDAIYELVQSLLASGVPIHGVGLQMHVVVNSPPSAQDTAANMARLGALGLQVQITEMDVRIRQPATPSDAEQQAEIYQAMLQTCLDADNCNTFVTWGYTDRYSWVPGHFEGWGDALIFDRDYRAKPAYHSLAKALMDNQTN